MNEFLPWIYSLLIVLTFIGVVGMFVLLIVKFPFVLLALVFLLAVTALTILVKELFFD